MDILKEFLIPFSGLKLGKHQFEFQVNNTFFTHFGYDEFNDSNIKMNVVLEKKSNMLELNFSHKGIINVPCDLTNEDFDLPIKGKMKLIVRFGEEFNDDNDEFIILPHDEFQVNVAQYCYEMMVLSVPKAASSKKGVRTIARRRVTTVDRSPSGRERHDEKITVYLSPDELFDLDQARLQLRGDLGLAVDRGRIVRESIAVIVADLEAKGDQSILARRLRGI